MPPDDILTDDYVAGLLAADAQDRSLKYSALGMDAYRTGKKPEQKPKPNKRFLRHIIKDTDTHNRNLLAKEAAESKVRLNELEQAEEARRLKSNPNAGDIRRRQMGDIHAILGNKKRSRTEDDARGDIKDRKQGGQKQRRTRDEDIIEGSRRRRDRHRLKEVGDGDDSNEEPVRSSLKQSKTSYSLPLSKKQKRGSSERDHGDHGSLARKRRERSTSPSNRHRKRRHRSPSPQGSQAESTSDDILGPLPAPKVRGRGAPVESSGMDRRFSDSYDPAEDLQDDNDQQSWSRAVDDFRAQQKMRHEKATRQESLDLEQREAFGDLTDHDSTRLQWNKRGSTREWDKDKA